MLTASTQFALDGDNINVVGRHLDERAADVKELSSYYGSAVLRGPDAFIEVAIGFADYADAMERKLLRELQSIALSAVAD